MGIGNSAHSHAVDSLDTKDVAVLEFSELF